MFPLASFVGSAASSIPAMTGAALSLGTSGMDYANQQETRDMQERLTHEGWNRSEAAAEVARNFQEYQMGRAMTFNRKEAMMNRQWQTEMSNSQWQRAVKDMKKAGINPMLAFMKGGAGVPSGSQGSVSSGASPMAKHSGASKLEAPILGERIMRSIATANDIARTKKDLDVGYAQKVLTENKAEVEKMRAKTEYENAKSAYYDNKRKKEEAQFAKLKGEKYGAEAAMEKLEAEIRGSKAYQYNKAIQESVQRWIDMGTGIFRDIMGPSRTKALKREEGNLKLKMQQKEHNLKREFHNSPRKSQRWGIPKGRRR